MKQQGEAQKLVYKQAKIEGLSLFCDWVDADAEENGGVDLERLKEERPSLKAGTLADSYFMEVLNREFTDEESKRSQHRLIVNDFRVEGNLQLNKDVKQLSRPATLTQPYFKAQISLGSAHVDKQSPSFGVYQPQLIRVLRVIELIGFFIEFSRAATMRFSTNRMTPDEVEEYIVLYQEWHCIREDKDQEELAKELRSQMYELEKDHACYPTLIELRQRAQQKIKSKAGEQQKLAELEAEIQKEIRRKTGLGWFTSQAAKQAIEAAVR